MDLWNRRPVGGLPSGGMVGSGSGSCTCSAPSVTFTLRRRGAFLLQPGPSRTARPTQLLVGDASPIAANSACGEDLRDFHDCMFSGGIAASHTCCSTLPQRITRSAAPPDSSASRNGLWFTPPQAAVPEMAADPHAPFGQSTGGIPGGPGRPWIGKFGQGRVIPNFSVARAQCRNWRVL